MSLTSFLRSQTDSRASKSRENTLFVFLRVQHHCMYPIHTSTTFKVCDIFNCKSYFKVKILWEGHKIWKIYPTLVWHYLVMSKQDGRFFKICLAFSKYLIFKFQEDQKCLSLHWLGTWKFLGLNTFIWRTRKVPFDDFKLQFPHF